MNKPNEPIRPNDDNTISGEVRDELLRRLETYPQDRATARPAREVLDALLKRSPADVQP